MAVANNNGKYSWNNVSSRNFKYNSITSLNTATSKTETETVSEHDTDSIKKRTKSMTDEEIIQKNLKELMDKKHQEERKANGRLVAVILALLVIFLAIYHAWIRNSGVLAGILIPAVIMLSFGAWVVVLVKRDKTKRQVFEKYLQEVALRNKQELEAKSKSKCMKSKGKNPSDNISLHYENEIDKERSYLSHLYGTTMLKSKDHRKHRKHRNPTNSDCYSASSSCSKKLSHSVNRDFHVKRPSIRQKIFRKNRISHIPAASPASNATHTLVQAVINTPVSQCTLPLTTQPLQRPAPSTLLEIKRKRLQRINSLQLPTMVRMSSAP